MAKKTKLSSMVAKPTMSKPVPVKIVSDVDDAPSKPRGRDKWEIEDSLRTLQRAEEIQKDKSLMKDVKQMAKTKMNELKKIC